MEVLVGVALMGICVAVLLGLVADNLRLTRKLTERNKTVFVAINKTEEAFLGILGDRFERVGDEKVWRGKTSEGLPWKVVERTSKESERTLVYDVTLPKIHLLGVNVQK